MWLIARGGWVFWGGGLPIWRLGLGLSFRICGGLLVSFLMLVCGWVGFGDWLCWGLGCFTDLLIWRVSWVCNVLFDWFLDFLGWWAADLVSGFGVRFQVCRVCLLAFSCWFVVLGGFAG